MQQISLLNFYQMPQERWIIGLGVILLTKGMNGLSTHRIKCVIEGGEYAFLFVLKKSPLLLVIKNIQLPSLL